MKKKTIKDRVYSVLASGEITLNTLEQTKKITGGNEEKINTLIELCKSQHAILHALILEVYGDKK